MGRYIDLLPQDARERVLGAPGWITRWLADYDGARNLLGHAEDWSIEPGAVPRCAAPEVFRLRERVGDELWTDEPRIGIRFARLVQRRGMERAVAVVRARVRREKPASRTPPIRGALKLVV